MKKNERLAFPRISYFLNNLDLEQKHFIRL